MKPLGQALKARRIAFHETQAEFGKRFGVSTTAVSLWEGGYRNIPNKIIEWLISGELPKYEVCNKCGGCGLVINVQLSTNNKDTLERSK